VDCYVTRALPAELEANARELDAYRQRQLAGARASNSAASRALGVGALKTKNFIMDYAQSALIAAVIGFKLTEWWYGAAEERVVGAATLPVPPPPPRPPPHPEGIALPDDTGLCPLCRKQIRNPAVLTCSGYVFCFACVHAHVDRYGDCPVSRHRAFNGVDDIRRVYEGN
jgi:peroxin-12